VTYEPYRELLADWQIAEAIRDAKSDDPEIADAAREQLPELIAQFFDGRGAAHCATSAAGSTRPNHPSASGNTPAACR